MTEETKITDLDSMPETQAEEPAKKPKGKAVKAAAADSVESDAPVEKGVEVASKTRGSGLSGKKVDITIHNGDGDSGKLPVDVGVNGYLWRIKRNMRVTVPIEVVGVLQNAVQAQYSKGEKNAEIKSEVPRFPMTVHF